MSHHRHQRDKKKLPASVEEDDAMIIIEDDDDAIPPSHDRLLPARSKRTAEDLREEARNMDLDQLQDFFVKKRLCDQPAGDFHPEAKKEDANKCRMNEYFAESCSTSWEKMQCPDDEKFAVILESSNMVTTQYLMEIGFQARNILIPQYYEEEYKRMKTVHPAVFLSTLHQLLTDIDACTISAAWFDYTCTITGNKACRPMEDIDLYFRRQLPGDYSTFSVTFCKRNAQVDDIISVSKKQVHDIAERYKYFLTRERVEEYSNMYFMQWIVIKK